MDRKLAAILAADVVGYSSLMERDESGTFDRVRATRRQLFEPEIANHNGNIFKLMGDGLLAEFGSVFDAVECAVSLQRGMAERNATLSNAEQFEVRIGINLGEVIVEGDDRYGEGVNVAARLQELSHPGGICVSAKVVNEVKSKLPFAFQSMGAQRVKNITEPVIAYRVQSGPVGATTARANARRGRAIFGGAAMLLLGLGVVWWGTWKLAGNFPAVQEIKQHRPTLAVLPFNNLSDDKEQEYLANGFTEDLTTELARIPGLFVVSRNAAFAYKDQEIAPSKIAAALGVRYLLEGSVRRLGDDMRINAQLIDSSNGGHLWAERFDGNWSSVFRLRDAVFKSIAGALRVRLAAGSQNVRPGDTTNAEAYDAYLKGMDIYNRVNSPTEFAQAVNYFQDAVSLDPNFGSAYAQLARAYWEADDTLAVMMGLSIDEAHAKALETLGIAARQPSTGYYQLLAELMVREHRSDEAVTVLLKSVALDPSDPSNYLGLAKALNFNGRPKEAIGYLDAAARVDPNSASNERLYLAGLAPFYEDKFEDAAQTIERIDPGSSDFWTNFYALQVLLSAYGHLGRGAQATNTLDRLKKVLGHNHFGEMTQLISQDYMVFSSITDAERLLSGLGKAGPRAVRIPSPIHRSADNWR